MYIIYLISAFNHDWLINNKLAQGIKNETLVYQISMLPMLEVLPTIPKGWLIH